MAPGKSFREIQEFLTVSEDVDNVFYVKDGYLIVGDGGLADCNRIIQRIILFKDTLIEIIFEDDDGSIDDAYFVNIDSKLDWAIYKQI
jgi:hypothetical protein